MDREDFKHDGVDARNIARLRWIVDHVTPPSLRDADDVGESSFGAGPWAWWSTVIS
jgi:hypothetical protein